MLPTACYHFPRRSLTDLRGTFITLSHFCPTAASQLFRQDVELAIVERPPAFPAARDYDPLDGCGEWPPLVRPTVLFDLRSFSRWEQFLVDTFAIEQPAPHALAAIAETAERLRNWSPACGSFAEHVERTLGAAASRPATPGLARYATFGTPSTFETMLLTIPAGLARPELPRDVDAAIEWLVEPRWTEFSTPVRRYLAAKAFGSWSAYQGRGVRTLVAELVASEAVLRVEAARACLAAARTLDASLLHDAIRQADWLLMHLADRARLMRWFGRTEDDRWLQSQNPR
jgi:hypothetical protein